MKGFIFTVIVSAGLILLTITVLNCTTDPSSAQEETPTSVLCPECPPEPSPFPTSSPEPTPWPQPPYLPSSEDADVDASGNVDVIDLMQVAANVGPAPKVSCSEFVRDPESYAVIEIRPETAIFGEVIRECP